MPKQHPTVLEEDKKLAGAIEKHRCLYDRKSEEFNDVNCVQNAWEEIASELQTDLENLKKQFQILKKRYSRKRHDQRRAAMNASASFTHELLEDEAYRRTLENLEEYSFMKWLDPHIRFKSVKEDTSSDFPGTGTSNNDSSEYNSYKTEDSSSVGRQQMYADSSMLENSAPSMTDVLVISQSEVSRHSNDNYENGSSLESLHHQTSSDNTFYVEASAPKRQRISVLKTPQTDTFRPNNVPQSNQNLVAPRNNDEIFGEMIAAEMKTFPNSMKFKVKHEINNVIYKYHLECYEKQNQS